MSFWSWKAGVAGVAVLAATAYAVAQMPGHEGMHGPMGQMTSPQGAMSGPMRGHRMMGMMQGQQGKQGQMGGHGMMGQFGGAAGQPTMPGQAAFGTIQEIVRILEADPSTDWSKVNIAALRQHLIDMDEVTLRAVANEQPLDNGVEISVTGEGRTLEAIKRMIPAHAGELARLGWNARTEDLPNGLKLAVTSTDAKEAAKLNALGFMGIMVAGGHHQSHHLMMATGDFDKH
jgi:hypothetical protein